MEVLKVEGEKIRFSYSSEGFMSEPTTPTGKLRVSRGGSWNGGSKKSRVFSRAGSPPAGRGTSLGFRLCRTVL